MKKLYYFAFGSNILRSRIERRVDEVKKVGNYSLKGYKLVFNCGGWGNVYANIIEGGDKDYVEGCLYELDPRQIAVLDRFEACPFNYYKEYFIHPDGNVCFVYVATDEFLLTKHTRNKLPELDYLNILLDGCVENGFKKTFKELFKYKEDNYRLVNNRHSKVFEKNF